MHMVIAYDISDDGRRTKIAQVLEGRGRRVQKSVFECDLTGKQLKAVRARLGELMDPATDRCHFYPLCADCREGRMVLGSDLEADWGKVVIA